jgi:hypothetical protein
MKDDLSPRAWSFLREINDACKGTYRYWLGEVRGAPDVMSLRSLERRGLIKRNKATSIKHAYQITAKGREKAEREVETRLEGQGWPSGPKPTYYTCDKCAWDAVVPCPEHRGKP